MKDVDNIAVIIQARLNSERVPRKMIKNFNGTTLLDIALEKLFYSDIISMDNVWLCVYEQELIEIGNKYGVNIFCRSEASSNSEGERLTEIYEWWDKIPQEYCVMINACAPFLELETIEEFVKFYANIDDDSVGAFGVIEKKNYFWNERGEALVQLEPSKEVMNTKTVATTREAAHCLYAAKLSKIGEGIWMGDFNKPGDIRLFSIEEQETFDIDYPWQFQRALQIHKSNNE